MPDISLKLQLRSKVTQLQQLTVKLLNLHTQDLTDFLHEQVTDNPLLDIRYPDVRPAGGGQEKPIDNLRSSGESLEELLMKQLRVMNIPKRDLLAAGLVIRSLDEKGFFSGDLDALGMDYGLTLEEMQQGLAVIQTLDPAGVGAASLQEAMLIQTNRRPDAPAKAKELLAEHYEDFLSGKWQRLQKEMDMSVAELNAIRNFLKTLSLQPAQQINEDDEYVRADAEIIIDENGKIGVRLLEEVPEVFFREDLYADYNKEKDKETRKYVHKARRAFLDLQSALAYRRHSILVVLTGIIETQDAFFRTGAALQPLSQKKLAEMTGLSESTVSRVCRDRYILFNRQIYPVKNFFTQAYHTIYAEKDTRISAQAIKEEITRIINDEDPDQPYSDQELVEKLAQENIKIARRTVAKFRIELGFVNSNMRRRIR